MFSSNFMFIGTFIYYPNCLSEVSKQPVAHLEKNCKKLKFYSNSGEFPNFRNADLSLNFLHKMYQGHWLFLYLTWAIWIRNEGVVPINMTEMSDIENDVVPPPLNRKIFSHIWSYFSMTYRDRNKITLVICS